jgi:two-component system sensor histidine kinase TctE
VVGGVNQLIERVAHAKGVAGKFVADAAHQLRTPLAALSTRVELTLIESRSGAPCPHTRVEIGQIAQRAAHFANQLLLSARAESDAQRARPPVPWDLKDIASTVAAEWGASRLLSQQDLGFELERAPVVAHPFLLREIFNNLLHNALTYARDSARVTVRTRTQGERSLLEVEDDGPGRPTEERAAAFERFVRGQSAPRESSGLGLAIVIDIARLHHGGVQLLVATGRRGLLVRVSFPAASAQPETVAVNALASHALH